jgi:hypothetical protein
MSAHGPARAAIPAPATLGGLAGRKSLWKPDICPPSIARQTPLAGHSGGRGSAPAAVC